MGRVAFTLDGAAKAASVSRRMIVDAAKAGTLNVREVDGRAIILKEDITAWVTTLPLWDFS